MIVLIAAGIGAMIVFLADVEFAAEDGLNALLFRRIEEMHRTINIAMISDSHRLLANRFDALDQLFYITGAVQEGIIRMQMQVGKFSHGQIQF